MTQQGFDKVLSRLVDKYESACVCDGKADQGMNCFPSGCHQSTAFFLDYPCSLETHR